MLPYTDLLRVMESTGSEKRLAEELYMGLDLSTQQVHPPGDMGQGQILHTLTMQLAR